LPGGSRRDEDSAQPGIQRTDQPVTKIQISTMRFACFVLHSVKQCFDEEMVKPR
jgi:hypothetical protein